MTAIESELYVAEWESAEMSDCRGKTVEETEGQSCIHLSKQDVNTPLTSRGRLPATIHINTQAHKRTQR